MVLLGEAYLQLKRPMKRMNDTNEDLRSRIEKMLLNRQTSRDVEKKNLEELIQEVNIYHQELEFQNEELIRIQSELEKSRKHYLELFEQAPIGYIIYDESLTILAANEMFFKLTGTTKADVNNQSITKFIHPDSQDTFYFHNNKLWKTREASQCEIFLSAGDHFLPIEIESSLYHHASQTYIRSALIDLSLIKKNEDRLHHEVARAERSDKLKSVFLNNLSHEIRTPLNAIVGFSEFLNEEGLDREQIRHLTGVIRQSSDQLLEIIEEIVSISTIEAGLTDLFVSDTNIGDLMNDIHDKFLAKAKLKEIKFRMNNRLADNEYFVETDASKLTQVLSNLVDNALKFTDKGHVEFGCSLENGYINFYVADTGVGIPQDFHTVIFERFNQVETEQSRMRGGMGLGLPISKAYVDMLGGKIWLDSGEGQGSTFFFTLPYSPFVRKPISVTKRPARMNTTDKTILIAEDEENNFELTRVILSSFGMEILHAWDGLQAIQMVQSHPEISLVLMDIKMPLMNGHEATRQIKNIKPDLPVIALTAYALPGDREKAIECGCDDYMAKPIALQEFISKVNKYL